MRRHRAHMNRERYCGNTLTHELHDLDNEREDCRIEEIIDEGHERGLVSLQQAHYFRFYKRHDCVIISEDEHDAAYLPEDER